MRRKHQNLLLRDLQQLIESRLAEMMARNPTRIDYYERYQTIISNYNPEAAVVISTHLIADVENILDDVAFLNRGHLLLQSSADELRAREGKSVDAVFREVFRC